MAGRKYEHAGHRKRMKDKYFEYGMEVFLPHEILEILLYYPIQRKDTNSIAHKLIDEFGSISAVMEASYDSLVNTGISKDTALFLKLIPALGNAYMEDKFRKCTLAVNSETIPQRLIGLFLDKTEEIVYMVLIDSKSKELYSEFINSSLNFEKELKIKKICEMAIRYSARNVIIAYNHPDSVAVPNKADITTTIELYQALFRLNVVLEDNFFVSGKRCISFRKCGIFFKRKEDFINSVFYDNPLFE